MKSLNKECVYGGWGGFHPGELCPCCKIQRNGGGGGGGGGDYVYGVKFIGGSMSISLAILKLIFFTIVHICKGNI